MTDHNAADITLIRRSIAFACWAAGEGICPIKDRVDDAEICPEEFFMEYSVQEDDEDWETLAERISAKVALMQEKLAEITGKYETMQAAPADLVFMNAKLRVAIAERDAKIAELEKRLESSP